MVTSLEKTKLCWMHLPSQMSVLPFVLLRNKPWWLRLPLSSFFPFPFAATACSAAKENHLSKRNQTFLLLQGWLFKLWLAALASVGVRKKGLLHRGCSQGNPSSYWCHACPHHWSVLYVCPSDSQCWPVLRGPAAFQLAVWSHCLLFRRLKIPN